MNNGHQTRITATANLPRHSRTAGTALPVLANTLKTAGYATQCLSFADGSHLLLLPHGGRVLGLFPTNSGRNFLWTHDALRLPQTIRELYTHARWPNPGGDRTWLAPVPELFFSDMDRLWETFREPAALDPGRYFCETHRGMVSLVNRAKLQLFRTKTTAVVEITKRFQPAANPLRHETGFRTDYQYAGYTSLVSLRILSDPLKAAAALGIYQLLQLPPGGEMIMPTHSRAKPLVMFGKIPDGHLKTENHFVRYRMVSKTTAKIALRAVHTTGRMGYLHRSETDDYDLVIRNFFVNPSGEYVDPPFDNLNDLGYSIQACNVAEPTLGFFSELEHHAPAVGKGTGSSSCTDVSQVWAFRGNRKVIADIAKLLLGWAPAR